MARLQTEFRQRLLLVLGALLNVGALALAAFAFVDGDPATGAFWLAVAVGWLVLLRVVLNADDGRESGESGRG